MKEMEKRTFIPDCFKYKEGEIEGSIKWIKNFFNLTEEDLMEKTKEMGR